MIDRRRHVRIGAALQGRAFSGQRSTDGSADRGAGFGAATDGVSCAQGGYVSLADFIEQNVGTLVAEWKKFAQTRLPAAEFMDEGALKDGSESILLAVAEDMRLERTDVERRERSRGERPEHGLELNRTAQLHAADRIGVGFTLEQLISEYRALRASVIRDWVATGPPADCDSLEQLVRFDEAMDQSVTEAIKSFSDLLERSRSTFVGMLGHDLRSPLSVIMNSAEIVLLTDDRDAHKRAAESIRRNGRHMNQMITDLLDFSRTRLGAPLGVSPEPTDLGALCREIVHEMAVAYDDREIKLETRGDLGGEWDAGRIRQMLSNLIKNALEHGDASAPIAVMAGGVDGDVTLAVTNEGPPIPFASRHVIFDPLVRDTEQPYSKKARASGLGLGLYIVKQVAEVHGGTVTLESNEQDGTTFTVRLPRRAG